MELEPIKRVANQCVCGLLPCRWRDFQIFIATNIISLNCVNPLNMSSSAAYIAAILNGRMETVKIMWELVFGTLSDTSDKQCRNWTDRWTRAPDTQQHQWCVRCAHAARCCQWIKSKRQLKFYSFYSIADENQVNAIQKLWLQLQCTPSVIPCSQPLHYITYQTSSRSDKQQLY